MMQYLRQDNYFGPVVQTLESPRQEVPKVYTKIEHFQEVVPNFVLENGHLYRYIQGDVKLCIPQALVLNYLYQNHNTPGAAHGGITATSKRIARHYYWPTLLADVKRYVSRCELCQVYKDPSRQTRQPLGDLPMPQRPWHRVHMDVWSPGGESQDGNRYVVGFIDAYTKFAVLVPTSDHTAETISQVVMKNLVAVHGPPEVLVSDGAPEFVGTIQTELYKGLGVIRKVISPYHPQANGQIERLFRTIKPMLAIAARNHQHEWAEYVPLIAYAYNTAYHESIRNTPYFLLYGRDPAPGDTPSANNDNISESVPQWLSRLQWARDQVTHELQQAHERNRHYYDQRVAAQDYHIGDLVLIRNVAPNRAGPYKLEPRFVGPYRVIERKWDTLHVRPLQYPDAPVRRIHINLTKPCVNNPTFFMTRQELEQPFLDPAMVDPNLEAEAQ